MLLGGGLLCVLSGYVGGAVRVSEHSVCAGWQLLPVAAAELQPISASLNDAGVTLPLLPFLFVLSKYFPLGDAMVNCCTA